MRRYVNGRMTNDIPNHPNFPELDPDDVLTSEVIEPPAIINENSLVRRVALQVLYEVDSADHAVGEVLSQQTRFYQLTDDALDYLNYLVTGVLERTKRLDRVISRFAPEWPVDQLAIVDRNILRMAVFELCFNDEVPIKVAIDEAVELAKWFGAEGSTRFVNGVLGAVTENVPTVHDLLKPMPSDTA
jgi:N utilization substance protein B